MPRRKKVEEEEVYHVEVITKARVGEEGEWEYFVKWAGYESDADSWESTENVKQCDRLLASFWKHVGTDDNDYPIGYEIAAEQDWINKEKRYFEETFLKPSRRKSDKATKRDRQERRKSQSSVSHMSGSITNDSKSSSEEFPGKTPTKKPARKACVDDTESESESEPLSLSDSRLRKQVKALSRSKAMTPPPTEASKASNQAKRQELPLVTGSSMSIALPKSAVRTHQDQRTNPLVKSINLPSGNVEAGSSLSTKQRVAAGIPPPPTGPKPLPLLPKKSLPALSFKKNRPIVPAGGQTKDTTTSSMPITTPVSPVAHSTDFANGMDMVASPQPMDNDQPLDIWGPILDDAGPLGGSSLDISTATIPLKSQEEIDAEKFLQTIHIPVLSGPLEMTAMTGQPDQLTAESTKSLGIPKIPRKWKWSGDLFINTSKSKTELLCAITITDPSGTSNTSHINLLLSSLDSLQIPKLHLIMDVSPLLRACGKPQYHGILESKEPSEEVIIHGLECHLTSEGLAAVIPLFLDATEVAVLIIFPGAQQGLSKVLQVPDCLQSGSPLLVVLLPFVLPVRTLASVAGQRSTETMAQSLFNPQDISTFHEPSQEAMLYQAMSLLCFPKTLLDFLNSTSTRTYCIWPLPDLVLPGLDTAMLQYILKSTRAILAKLEEDVRVVFISSQHLKAVHTMPFLVAKLINSPEVQFWTYGYSANMTSQEWKVQEIYPLGGIITFTPSALVEDLVGCHQLMSQIIEHPLWDCYLIPEALAVSHLLYSDGDVGSPSESYLDPILDLVNLGLISAIRMPEKGHSNQMDWLSQVFDHCNASGHELLEVYIRALGNHSGTSGMTAEQLITFANNEITKDLSNAQIQPVFIKNYRRFVVIRATSEDTTSFEKNGLEWLPLSLFNFKDDYFQS